MSRIIKKLYPEVLKKTAARWVEQQGKSAKDLTEQWDPDYWRGLFEDEVNYFDQLIEEFNAQTASASGRRPAGRKQPARVS